MKKIIVFLIVLCMSNISLIFAETEIPRGNVILRWEYVQASVGGYAIYLWDGYAYREIDRVSQDIIEWDSDETRIYPKEETLALYEPNSVTQSLFAKKGKGERLRNNPNGLYKVMADGMAHPYSEYKDSYIFKIATINEVGEVNLSTPIVVKLENWDAGGTPRQVEISINNGDAKTTTNEVELNITASDDTTTLKDLKMRFANEKKENFSEWESFSGTKSWKLTTGEGEKTVFIEVKDKDGAVTTASDKIIFEEIKVLDFNLTTNNGAYATELDKVHLFLNIENYNNYICSYKIDGGWEMADITSEGGINIALEKVNKNIIKVKLESRDGTESGESEIVIWKL